jgi:hypothetical protein
MLLKLFTTLTLVFSAALCCYGQLTLPEGRQGAVRPFNEYVLSDWVLKHADKYKDIEGTPFLHNQWVKGEIQTIRDERFQNVLLKLNLYEGQLIHQNNFTGDSSVIQESLLWAFSIPLKDTVYQFERFDASPPLKPMPLKDFFVVLVRDQFTLLAKPHVHLQRATDNSLVNSVEKQRDRFVHRTQYYVWTPDKKLIRLRNQKKALRQIFGDYYQGCIEFTQQRGFDWNKPQHLSELLTYYNNIL